MNKKYIFVFIYLDFFPRHNFHLYRNQKFSEIIICFETCSISKISQFFFHMTLVSRDFPIAAESCQQQYEK